MSPPDEPADLSMLEFFHSELTASAAVIQAGLPALLDGPAPAPEAAAPLARAAGSIKAAARIVGLAGIEPLARAVEEALETARGDGRLAGRDTGELLLAAAAAFIRLSGREAADIPRALGIEAEGLADLAAALSGALGEPAGTAPAGQAEPGAFAAGVPAPPVAPAPAGPAGPAAATLREPDLSQADMSMLDLFRLELETNAAVLDAGLVALETDQRPERVEPLMRAAHSVKGAARIVGLGQAVELAHAMEDLLEACRQGRLHLTGGHIDLLLAGNDIFSRLAGFPAGNIPAGLAAMAEGIAQVRGGLDASRADPGAPPPGVPRTTPSRDGGPGMPATPATQP